MFILVKSWISVFTLFYPSSVKIRLSILQFVRAEHLAAGLFHKSLLLVFRKSRLILFKQFFLSRLLLSLAIKLSQKSTPWIRPTFIKVDCCTNSQLLVFRPASVSLLAVCRQENARLLPATGRTSKRSLGNKKNLKSILKHLLVSTIVFNKIK